MRKTYFYVDARIHLQNAEVSVIQWRQVQDADSSLPVLGGVSQERPQSLGCSGVRVGAAAGCAEPGSVPCECYRV